MPHKNWLVYLLLLWAACLAGQPSTPAYTVESVPDPMRSGGGYVSNPDGYLSPTVEAEINRLLAKMEQTATAQMAVAVVGSIGEQVPKDFAHQLFNHWKPGQKSNDNGVLLLVVMDQRRAEIETGNGVEGILPDVVCYRILLDYLVPNFQKQDYDTGVFGAVYQIKARLEDPAVREEVTARRNAEDKRVYNIISGYLTVNGVFHLALLVWILLTLANKDDLYDKYRHVRYGYSWVFILLFPLPYIFTYLILRALLKRLRNQPRYSPATGELMHKLSEEEEDAYLERGQIIEEELRVTDYDVWATEQGDDVVILPYKRLSFTYKRCPKCQFRTYYQVHNKVTQVATPFSNGQGEVLHECKNCNYIERKQFTIRYVPPSSGGSSGRSGSRGGGSWGGGRSSGGGAGASW